LKILIVEDDRNLCEFFSYLLDMSQHTVFIVNDGVYALEEYKKRAPDIVLMDHRMPWKSGLEAIKEILNFEPAGKVLFCSADPTVKQEALDAGAIDFLKKPFDYKILLEKLKLYE